MCASPLANDNVQISNMVFQRFVVFHIIITHFWRIQMKCATVDNLTEGI